MFAGKHTRSRRHGPPPELRTAKRHGRRPIRSSLSGPALSNPHNRLTRFELDARGAIDLLMAHFPSELHGVSIGYQSVPNSHTHNETSPFYSIDRSKHTIVMFRMPIQRARGLHVEDDEHRRYFVEHCVYRAVCEYLGREPWDLLPGRFDHY